MRIDPMVLGSATPGSRATTGEPPDLAQLIAELKSAGLVSVEVDDDGNLSFALTQRGERAALLMAMSRHGHALVLLGALMGTDDHPN